MTAPMGALDDPKLRFPFDQYQRYRIAADLVAHFGVPTASMLLEVGGAPGPLEQFLPDHELAISDVDGKQEGRFLLADGSCLPFSDETFPAVVALDTLEHVPVAKRPAFLDELRRTSSDLVVLSAPFASDDVEFAETVLNEFVRARLQVPFPTLEEHAEHGLPELDATVGALAVDGWSVATLPSGFLPRWLVGMLVHHDLLASGVTELPRLHAFYNAWVSPHDCSEPAYRHVVLAARGRSTSELEAALAPMHSGGDGTADAALAAIGGWVFSHRMEATLRSDALERRATEDDARIAALQREVADRDAHIIELRAIADQLRAERDDAQRYRMASVQRNRWFGLRHAAKRIIDPKPGSGSS